MVCFFRGTSKFRGKRGGVAGGIRKRGGVRSWVWRRRGGGVGGGVEPIEDGSVGAIVVGKKSGVCRPQPRVVRGVGGVVVEFGVESGFWQNDIVGGDDSAMAGADAVDGD